MDEQYIKEVILGKLSEHMNQYRAPTKTLAELVTFLVGLDIDVIKTAVVAALNAEKVKYQNKYATIESGIDSAIDDINTLS